MTDQNMHFDTALLRDYVTGKVAQALAAAQEAGELPAFEVADFGVSPTTDPANGDWTSTVAMRSAKAARRKPADIAGAIVAYLEVGGVIERAEVAGPGFLNMWIAPAALTGVFGLVREQGKEFGRYGQGAGRKVNVEYVSANPVGPMHVGHGRWAALGDSLCNVLEFCGWDVTREFYINDAGSQMDVFARSIEKRYRQIIELMGKPMSADEACAAIETDRLALLDDPDGVKPETHPLSDDFNDELGGNAYGGAYIVDIARTFLDSDGQAPLSMGMDERLLDFRERGYAMMLGNIKSVLASCGAEFDVWYSERTLHAADESGQTAITRAFDMLREAGYLYESEGALWFRSTDLGDDKDRVLVKTDGSYTYFAADIAYHADKLFRGFDRLIDIWGADHHGYVPRMKAFVSASGHDGALDVLLGQLVNLLRDGVPVRMSKRKGTMVTFEELLEEVGPDATRFTLLSRSSDQEIDFDIAVAKRQSSDNPVYYVQYAHARICSILRKAAGIAEYQGDIDMDALADGLIGTDVDFGLLTDPSEVALARLLGGFGDTVASCARDLASYRLTFYALDLAAAFHTFYNSCHVLTDDAELTRARLCACDAARRVLARTLGLIGISAPQSMVHRTTTQDGE